MFGKQPKKKQKRVDFFVRNTDDKSESPSVGTVDYRSTIDPSSSEGLNSSPEWSLTGSPVTPIPSIEALVRAGEKLSQLPGMELSKSGNGLCVDEEYAPPPNSPATSESTVASEYTIGTISIEGTSTSTSGSSPRYAYATDITSTSYDTTYDPVTWSELFEQCCSCCNLFLLLCCKCVCSGEAETPLPAQQEMDEENIDVEKSRRYVTQ